MNPENDHTDSGDLIEKILRESREEAEKLTAEAKTSVAQRRVTLEKRIAEIGQNADERIAAEMDRLTKRADAAIALTEGRAKLRREERIYRAVTDRTREVLGELRSTDGYVNLLARWIAEAAEGLGAPEAIVTCSAADKPYLEEAVAAARRLITESGAQVQLRVNDKPDEPGQGVVLRDSAGRRAFSNLVEDRLRRYGSDLRRIVFHAAIEG